MDGSVTSDLLPVPSSFVLSAASAPVGAAGGSHGDGCCPGYAGTPRTPQLPPLQQPHTITSQQLQEHRRYLMVEGLVTRKIQIYKN